MLAESATALKAVTASNGVVTSSMSGQIKQQVRYVDMCSVRVNVCNLYAIMQYVYVFVYSSSRLSPNRTALSSG